MDKKLGSREFKWKAPVHAANVWNEKKKWNEGKKNKLD